MSALADRLKALREDNERMLEPDVREKSVRHIDQLRTAGAVLRALKAGMRAPEFSLRDQHARLIASHALLATGPLVIAFDRGTWCEYCAVAVTALAAIYDRIVAAGAELVVITPQSAANAAPYLREHPLPFGLLVDPDAKVAEAYGLDYDFPPYMVDVYRNIRKDDLTERTAGRSWRMTTPGIYVVDRGGTIVDAQVDPDYRFRCEPEIAIAALERVRLAAGCA